MIASALLSSRPNLLHAFTDRIGGVGSGPYDSRNLAYHVHDDDTTVDANHRRTAEALGYDLRRLVHMRQIHSDRVVVCDAGMGFDTVPECDALITNVVGQPLMVMTADCTPILLYDPDRHAVAAVHAGRAGALLNIVGATVEAMRAAFATAPGSLLAVLGPSIHACCYEIGPEVAEQVERAGCGYALRSQGGGIALDVNRILETQLLEAGLPTSNVETADVCTACRHDLFFSYRADRGTTGRQAGIIMLK